MDPPERPPQIPPTCTTRGLSRQNGTEARVEYEFFRRRRNLEYLVVLRHVVERTLEAGELDLALAAVNLVGDEIFPVDAVEDRILALGVFRHDPDRLGLVAGVPQPGMGTLDRLRDAFSRVAFRRPVLVHDVKDRGIGAHGAVAREQRQPRPNRELGRGL